MDHIYIDDSNTNIVYTGVDWVSAGGDSEYNKTSHGTSHSGSRFAYTFRGTSIGAFGTLGSISSGPVPPSGNFTIDNGPAVTFQTHPIDTNLYKQMFFQTPDMPDDVHTLVMTFSADKVIFWLDYLMVTPSVATQDPDSKLVKVEDDDSSIQYTGNWTSGGTSFDSNRTVHSTRSPGSEATFSFFGTSVSVFGRLPNSTISSGYPAAVFTLDDGNPTAFTAVPPIQFNSIYQVPIFQSSSLSLGQHTLKVQSQDSTTDFSLDFILYTQPVNATATSLAGGALSTSATAPSSTSTTSSGGRAPIGAIVGGSVGGGIGFLILVALAFLFWSRRSRKPAAPELDMYKASLPEGVTPFTGEFGGQPSLGRVSTSAEVGQYYPASPQYGAGLSTSNTGMPTMATMMQSSEKRRPGVQAQSAQLAEAQEPLPPPYHTGAV
ncbi:hypothetical protein AMATHDRAFT_4914 [Amanita thiersii Skay4041]|uniref:Transmembrane protein n=1 Tax=Amanita thiersii Skay4041 TaxID=703135 RepID=A0A2A9NMC1_9AGAR|nr:hypothetical protein AMATHDRAFT_4914 [Amanita thiersii Skay4041]